MLTDFIRNHKIVSLLTIVLLVSLIGYSLYIYISRIGKEPVTIYLVPNNASLTIGDHSYGQGTAYIAPGTYKVTATRDGFETHESTVTIRQPNEEEIDISLTPVSDEAKKWQSENMDQYLAFQSRTSVRANEFGDWSREQFPITTKLPFKNYIYSIGHKLKDINNPSAGITIEIDTITGYRNAAINKIRELGFDPTDYEINFNDYENPFSHE